MKLEHCKRKKAGLYAVTFDDGRAYLFYDEIILKYQLLYKNELAEEELEIILKENDSFRCYYTALELLNRVVKSSKEVDGYLIKKEFSKKDREQAIVKLQKQGYLNDLAYAKSFVHDQILTTSSGPLTIKAKLLKKGISENDFQEAIKEYDEEIEKTKIKKIVMKALKGNSNKSIAMLKRTIFQKLISDGFNKNLIELELDNLKQDDEDNIRQKQLKKIKTKLERKYSGKELEYRIKMKMRQLGFKDMDD